LNTMENKTIQRASLESLDELSGFNTGESEGSFLKPPEFNLTAKLHNTGMSPYEDRPVDDVGNRFAFGRSADSTSKKNIT